MDPRPNIALHFTPKEMVCVGKIGKPIGLKGWLNFWPQRDNVRLLPSLPIWLQREPEEGWRLFKVESLHPSGRKILINDIRDRDAASALTHAALYVKLADLPELPEGKFYWEELVGLRVRPSGSERVLGTVTGLSSTPSYDLLIIESCNPSEKLPKARPVLIPFLPGISVESVDKKRGLIDLLPIALSWIE